MAQSVFTAQRRLAALEWLIIAALVAAGLWLGARGTDTAHVDLPVGVGWDIEIGQTGDENQLTTAVDRDLVVSFIWTMTSSGFVEITARAQSASDLSAAPITLILYCGAQLDIANGDIVSGDGVGFRDVTVLGKASACRSSDPEIFKERERQVIRVVDFTQLRGFPKGTWTDSQAGQRLARTPSIGFSYDNAGLWEVSALSTAMTVLTSSITEQFDSATPPEVSEGEVIYGSGFPVLYENQNRETAAVQWETSAKPENTQTMPLTSGIARWTLADGQALPQWSLLFSGLLLGIASALVVEWPIAAYRSRLKSRADAVSRVDG